MYKKITKKESELYQENYDCIKKITIVLRKDRKCSVVVSKIYQEYTDEKYSPSTIFPPFCWRLYQFYHQKEEKIVGTGETLRRKRKQSRFKWMNKLVGLIFLTIFRKFWIKIEFSIELDLYSGSSRIKNSVILLNAKNGAINIYKNMIKHIWNIPCPIRNETLCGSTDESDLSFLTWSTFDDNKNYKLMID